MMATLSSHPTFSNRPSLTISGAGRADVLCLLCASPAVDVYRQGNDHDNDEANLTAANLGSSRRNVSHGRILRCRNCRFGFRATRPREEELSALYRQLDPLIYEKEASGRNKTAIRHLRIIQRYVQTGGMLDVGCASGAFLRYAADAGWKVSGVEPAEALCLKAKRRLGAASTVLCASLQEANFPPASFDALTLWDVLEHVPHPLPFMKHCASLLRPGGCLFANVPDLDSLQAQCFGERWPLLLAEHLNYFNRTSLRLCGSRAGLRLVNFGRRPASFSLEYLFYRLAQHGIPGTSLGHAIVRKTFLNKISVPVFLGETYGVWIRPLTDGI